uniref:Uncharacterized protein n=2 Tax=Lygus hesperus TaxID=30085 RepID=A0A146LMR9_LYGHE
MSHPSTPIWLVRLIQEVYSTVRLPMLRLFELDTSVQRTLRRLALATIPQLYRRRLNVVPPAQFYNSHTHTLCVLVTEDGSERSALVSNFGFTIVPESLCTSDGPMVLRHAIIDDRRAQYTPTRTLLRVLRTWERRAMFTLRAVRVAPMLGAGTSNSSRLCQYHSPCGNSHSCCPVVQATIPHYPNVVRIVGTSPQPATPSWYSACGDMEVRQPRSFSTVNCGTGFDTTISRSAVSLRFTHNPAALYNFKDPLPHASRRIDNVAISYNAKWLCEFVVGNHSIDFTTMSRQLYTHTLAAALRTTFLHTCMTALRSTDIAVRNGVIDSILPSLQHFLHIHRASSTDAGVLFVMVELLANPLVVSVHEMFVEQRRIHQLLIQLRRTNLYTCGTVIYMLANTILRRIRCEFRSRQLLRFFITQAPSVLLSKLSSLELALKLLSRTG